MMTSRTSAKRPSDAWFGTTRWSVVLAVGRSDTPRAQAALESLCSVYWRPLYYSYVVAMNLALVAVALAWVVHAWGEWDLRPAATALTTRWS